MRRSVQQLYKIPKNMGVAPRYDTWNAKYEPWEHMRRMGRLAGTGFYIPPEWYNHFRMFPPIQNNFQQEQTLNPQNNSEPTQDDRSGQLAAERLALRDELAHKSRLVASEGMRYYNIFWVRKPLDIMEKNYYDLKRRGIAHDVAIRKVLQEFYEELARKKRVSAIQAEEAKLSGKYITMREATVVMGVLTQIQREQLTPHQVALLAKEQRRTVQGGDGLRTEVSSAATTTTTAKKKDGAEAPAAAGAAAANTVSADSLADFLADAEEGVPEVRTTYTVKVEDADYNSVSGLQEVATDRTGTASWYSGASPLLDLEQPSAAGAAGSSAPSGGASSSSARGSAASSSSSSSSPNRQQRSSNSGNANARSEGGAGRSRNNNNNNNNNNNRGSNNSNNPNQRRRN